ncbi:CapA family protein [Virgibacillus halodenitrificans]|uniref:CapA family protein n=1 Tax=Virgibacillus halodenitrificans TaxID=1482 RepID=UPI000EF510D4|nr:CapA family protein [Virgibacillus halodenitrificans]MCJ0930390.1 CapA family protein [Virgibacillus halodenitrificans]MEC2159185.1 CapA family protein [Virgibacillus halodenitrificans]
MAIKKSIYFPVVLLLMLFLAGCQGSNPDTQVENHKKKDTYLSEKDKMNKQITLSAVGDILIHDRVYDDARVKDTFNFMPMLDRVDSYLKASSVTFANQETMVGGEEIGLSGYPRFNSPYEIGEALKKAGVDVVSLANNHTLDHGEEAIHNAINYWKEKDMMYTGAYESKADQGKLRIYETNEDISLAFLAYTYGTNGITEPENKDYLVNQIDEQQIATEIAEAEKQADVVVLSLHFGDEYERLPNERQKDLVQFAADQGADIILGHHPHVLQPVEWVEGKGGKRSFVIYSLGNFLSGQDEFYRRIGGVLTLTLTKEEKKGEEAKVKISNPQFLPTFVTFTNESDYKVVPMYQLKETDLPDAKKHYNEIKDHMTRWMEELQFPEQ